jgi:tripartite-type tricarboxylate transporter receptor subunit TctC
MMKKFLLLLAMLTPAVAQNYPERPVKIIVPFGAGGIADITVRIVANELASKFGQSFIVENIPGAGGVAAARAAIAGGNDGHSLLLVTNGTAVSKALFNALAYDPIKDFTPLSTLGTFDFFLASNTEKFTTLADILKAAKTTPDSLNIATIAVGSTQNLTARLFIAESKADLKVIPYRGTPDAVTGLMRNDSHILVEGYSTLKSTLLEGKFKAVASTGAKRSSLTPDVPTVQELLKTPFDVTSWNALSAPVGLSADRQMKLNQAIVEILAKKDIQAKLLDLGIEPLSSTPAELGKRLADDIVKWESIITKLGIAKQ